MVILLPDGETLEITTTVGGEHPHQLMVERTGLDGLHRHEITIGGRTLTSLSPAEFAALAPPPPSEGEDDLPPS